jgi:hypothetical protein
MSVPTQQARSHVASAKGDIRAAQKRVQYVVEGLQAVFGPQRSPGGAQDQLHNALGDLSDALVNLSRAQCQWRKEYEYCDDCGCNVTDADCSCQDRESYSDTQDRESYTTERDEANEAQERRGQYTCERCGTDETRVTLLFGSWLCDPCAREKMTRS